MASDGVALQREITAVLERLRRSLDGLVAVGLADANGLPVAFLGPAVEKKEAATAMAALVVGAAQRAVRALHLPRAREVLIATEGFNILIAPVGDELTLVGILANEANLGYARIQVDACSREIRAALRVD